MKTALIIVGVILSPMILYIVFAILGLIDSRIDKFFDKLLSARTEDEEQGESVTTRTGYSRRRKRIRRIIFALATVFFTVLTALTFIEGERIMGFVMLTFALCTMSIPLFICLQSELTYEIIGEDGIFVRRIFKRKTIKYSEMAYYKTEQGMKVEWTDLYVCSWDGKCLIRVVDGRVGTESLINALDSHGIKKEIYWLSDKRGTEHT